MSATLPLWVSVVAAVGTPVLAFSAVLLGHLLTRLGAREVEVRWQREETMRLLRWAADHSVNADRAKAELGLVARRSLGVSPLLQETDQRLVSEVLRAVQRMRRWATLAKRRCVLTRTIIVDELQVLAARIIMERAELGLQEADDEVRAYAAARQIGDSYDYEVVLEDQPA